MNTHRDAQVLLVEDNPRDAELTIRAFRRHKLTHRIVHVVDGQEALDWIFATGVYRARDIAERPKVVLLDLKLPKVGGLEVLRAVRADERTRRLPIIVLTSSREERDVIESYNLGVNSYIVKPVDFDNFSAAVTEAGHYWLLLNTTPS